MIRSIFCQVVLAATFLSGSSAFAQSPTRSHQAAAQTGDLSFNQSALERVANNIIYAYNLGIVSVQPDGSGNPDGKPLAQWQGQDIHKFSPAELNSMRAMLIDERYDLIDRIKPTAMSTAEFARAILRESAKRGLTEDLYDRRFNGLPKADVTVSRPLQVPVEQQRQVTATPVVLAISDAAARIMLDPRAGAVYIENDVAQQMGRPDLGQRAGFLIPTDTAAFDLGYTTGSMPQFRKGTPLGITLDFQNGIDQVQPALCAIIADIFARPGRSVDQTEAFSVGFALARFDGRSNYQGQENAVGLASDCPAQGHALTAQDRLNIALRH